MKDAIITSITGKKVVWKYEWDFKPSNLACLSPTSVENRGIYSGEQTNPNDLLANVFVLWRIGCLLTNAIKDSISHINPAPFCLSPHSLTILEAPCLIPSRIVAD